MPVKFRCAYCNQLMGIARRKVGTVVSCPSCNGQVVVPDPGIASPPQDAPAPSTPASVFERKEFDPALFQTPPTPPLAPQRAAPPTANMSEFDVQPVLFPNAGPEPTALPDTPAGPTKVSWLFVVLAVVLVVVGFATGFAVARLM